jgi:glyoxylate/hydroxypyruvate reductase A
MPGRDTVELRRVLAAELPGVRVREWPEIDAPDEVRMAVVWNHPPGSLGVFSNLELVCSYGAGVDHLLRDSDLPQNVEVVRVVDPQLVQDMVEYVVSVAGAHHRGFGLYRQLQREGRWAPRDYSRSPRALVLGLGELGGAVARALASLGWRVDGWSRSARVVEGVDSKVGREALEASMADAELVVCLLPLTPATDGLVDRALLARMRPDALLVNVGRGRLVVEADLLEALDNGRPGRAWLDVFAHEPLPPDHPFWTHPLVTVTPHVASLTDPAAAARLVADVWRRLDRGEPQPHRVDPRRGY